MEGLVYEETLLANEGGVADFVSDTLDRKTKNERRHPCFYCGKRFTAKHRLRGHLKSAHDVTMATKPRLKSEQGDFECDVCGRKFVHPSSVRSHMIGVHNMVPAFKINKSERSMHPNPGRPTNYHNPRFVCPQCGRGLSSRTSLRDHMVLMHEWPIQRAKNLFVG